MAVVEEEGEGCKKENRGTAGLAGRHFRQRVCWSGGEVGDCGGGDWSHCTGGVEGKLTTKNDLRAAVLVCVAVAALLGLAGGFIAGWIR